MLDKDLITNAVNPTASGIIDRHFPIEHLAHFSSGNVIGGGPGNGGPSGGGPGGGRTGATDSNPPGVHDPSEARADGDPSGNGVHSRYDTLGGIEIKSEISPWARNLEEWLGHGEGDSYRSVHLEEEFPIVASVVIRNSIGD